MVALYSSFYHSPVGFLEIVASERGIRLIRFVDARSSEAPPSPNLSRCYGQLEEYFQGKRRRFDSLELALAGSDFEQRVWEEAMKIPFGETRTYGDLAQAIGRPRSARAVGNALNANPLLIIVPCHRVVPANARSEAYGGYAGGEERKSWLLAHEKKFS